MTRSEAPWCGDAEFGPRPDDREVGLVVALGDETFSDFVRDVRLGATNESSSGDGGHDPVRGARGTAEQLDLVAVLDDAQRREASAMRARTGVRKIRAAGAAGDVARQGRPRQRSGAGPSRPAAARPARDQGVRVVALLPRSTTADAGGGSRDTIWRASLSSGVADEGKVTLSGMTRASSAAPTAWPDNRSDTGGQARRRRGSPRARRRRRAWGGARSRSRISHRPGWTNPGAHVGHARATDTAISPSHAATTGRGHPRAAAGREDAPRSRRPHRPPAQVRVVVLADRPGREHPTSGATLDRDDLRRRRARSGRR